MLNATQNRPPGFVSITKDSTIYLGEYLENILKIIKDNQLEHYVQASKESGILTINTLGHMCCEFEFIKGVLIGIRHSYLDGNVLFITNYDTIRYNTKDFIEHIKNVIGYKFNIKPSLIRLKTFNIDTLKIEFETHLKNNKNTTICVMVSRQSLCYIDSIKCINCKVQ